MDFTIRAKARYYQKAHIDWLKSLKNVASPTLPYKYGTMEADSLYINVYREDTRRNKQISTKNENFVCMVDYNISGKTTLEHGGIFKSIWDQLYHENLEKTMISWREGKYAVVKKAKKIGLNESCPCGSGKKYKKCCLKK